MQNWLLPEYIEDLLPNEAQQLEQKRRLILDLFKTHGYELVVPPLVEYAVSLLTTLNADLDLKTFKLVDQLSGKMLGLRADITPQVARIDAHLLNRPGVTRLCYAGSVVHTLPSGLMSTREPFQVGAELYGYAGIEADIEIQQLALTALDHLGVTEIQLDIGHIGIFRCLSRYAGLTEEADRALFQTLQTKDAAALEQTVATLDPLFREAFIALLSLNGNQDVLQSARLLLPKLPEIEQAITQLENIQTQLHGLVELRFDLAELRGGAYHNGLVFAIYGKGWHNAIVRGGRYDGMGQAFGRARPATGFSLDLREILGKIQQEPVQSTILAPGINDPALHQFIKDLRAQGKIVMLELPGSANDYYDYAIQKINENWQVMPV